MRNVRRNHHLTISLILFSLLLIPSAIFAQWVSGLTSRYFIGPYAGRYEGRLGLSWEPRSSTKRIDAGASVNLVGTGFSEPTYYPPDPNNPLDQCWPDQRYASAGVDLFTWSHLGASGAGDVRRGSFDYYAGINLATSGGPKAILDLRFRLAHIESHGFESDMNPASASSRYSREILDLLVDYNLPGMNHMTKGGGEMNVFRPYVGAVWAFHVVPDTLRRIIPYLGFDGSGSWDLRTGRHDKSSSSYITVFYGYELRLNRELALVPEHLITVGVKFGGASNSDELNRGRDSLWIGGVTDRAPGLLLNVSYYTGRSRYGAFFTERENSWSLGLGVEF